MDKLSVKEYKDPFEKKESEKKIKNEERKQNKEFPLRESESQKQ